MPLAKGRFVRSFAFRARPPTFDLGSFQLHATADSDGSGFSLWSSNNVGEIGLDAQVGLE